MKMIMASTLCIFATSSAMEHAPKMSDHDWQQSKTLLHETVDPEILDPGYPIESIEAAIESTKKEIDQLSKETNELIKNAEVPVLDHHMFKLIRVKKIHQALSRLYSMRLSSNFDNYPAPLEQITD